MFERSLSKHDKPTNQKQKEILTDLFYQTKKKGVRFLVIRMREILKHQATEISRFAFWFFSSQQKTKKKTAWTSYPKKQPRQKTKTF